MSTWLTVRPYRTVRSTRPVWPSSAFDDPFFNDAFNWVFGPTRRPATSASANVSSFGLNVGQDEQNYYVWAVLPGVSADKLEINALENKLTISGEVPAETFTPQLSKAETENKTAGEGETAKQPKFSWLRRELPTSATRFQREIEFPTAINADEVQAFYDNGILRLVVPQAPETRARRIAVSTPARPELNSR